MIRFEPSAPGIRKPVAYCDEPGCTEYAPFGFNSHMSAAIEKHDAKLAGKHFCRTHKPESDEAAA